MDKIIIDQDKVKEKLTAHGGLLRELVVDNEVLKSQLREKVLNLPTIKLRPRQLCDLELLLDGSFSPLEGFLDIEDYMAVVAKMRLKNGVLWPIPVVLDVQTIKGYKEGSEIVLCDEYGKPLAILNISSIYKPDKDREAKLVYGTTSRGHFGVRYLFERVGNYYIGGKVYGLDKIERYDFRRLRYTPRQLRQWFRKNGWKKIIGFQTRNPLHRVHYAIIKQAAKRYAAKVLIHPAVGLTKDGDINYVSRVRSYIKFHRHYARDFSKLCLISLAMRMAGPREALWHSIIRKNYGCTHFIIGRDHAGPGVDSNGNSFYHENASLELVKQYSSEIGIEVIAFTEMVYVDELGRIAPKSAIRKGQAIKAISGSQLRQMILSNKKIPHWFSFPEIIQEIKKGIMKDKKDGLTIFFTGLPSAGKSTLSRLLYFKLLEIQDKKITLLDGDVIRQNLSKGLGFSKEDRDINIRRIGFVASEITKHGGIAICAAIAPYRKAREENRKLICQEGNYVEVFLDASVEVCEQRDTKGLYRKAKIGIIENMTGVDDPYERPEHPEIHLKTDELTAEECLDRIVTYLQEKKLISINE